MASGSSPDQSGVGEESDSRPPLDKGKGIDRKVHPKASQVSDREGLSVRAARADSELYDDLPLVVWCPQIVATFRNFFSPETAAFLFSLPRKPAALRGHSGCSNTRCMANDTLLAEGGRYSSAHWKSCTGSLNCVFLGPEPQKIRDIIESGGIPLISIECGKDGRLKLDAIKATGRSKYIAVSHVWSGGLGNPHENSLPSCQIHRLFDMWPELISKTHSKPARGIWRWPKPTKALFWMDTLCIPLGKEHFYLKMRAINSMAKTYANAQAIIIFDHELQQTSHFDMPVSQIVGLIACSAWMSRCWTFQEGAMAKKWLLQFEDGIWCLDDIQEDPLSRREDHSALHELVELLKFFANVPRLISTVNQRTFSQRKFEAKIALFSQVWNGLCTRSTTKREDLISIIAIILDFRPAELLRIPAENRLLSLICAQEVLPLSLIYRERLGLKDWSEAYQWLPSTIEEKPIEVNGDMMWRRSPEEDFFILKFFSKVTDPKERKTRIYFMKTLVECDTSSLRLIDDDTGEKIIVDLQLPGDLRLPQLDICIMIGEIELVGPPLSAYGACLGIRHRDATRIQLYYICAVKCILVHPESRDYALPQNDCRTRVKQETILETTELAIEHSEFLCSSVFTSMLIYPPEFPPSSTLLEPRPLGDFPHSFEARRAVLRGPFAVQSFAYLFFWIASGFFWHDRGTGPRLGVSLGLFWARVVALYFENCFWHFSFAEAEFDEWYGGLYGDKVILGGTPFNIYHCPSVVYATLGLGLLAWPFFWLLERLLPGQRMLREVVFLVCEFELGLLIVKWLLEVSVQAALRVMFPPSQQLSEESRARVWYFKTFYAKSRLTTILERVLQVAWSALTFQPRRYPTSPSDHGFSEPTASGATALFETSEFIDDPSREPWSTKNVKVFEPTTDSRMSPQCPRKASDFLEHFAKIHPQRTCDMKTASNASPPQSQTFFMNHMNT